MRSQRDRRKEGVEALVLDQPILKIWKMRKKRRPRKNG